MEATQQTIRPNTFGFLRNLTDNPCPCPNCNCGMMADFNGKKAFVKKVLEDGSLEVEVDSGRYRGDNIYGGTVNPDRFEPSQDAWMTSGCESPIWESADSAVLVHEVMDGPDYVSTPKPWTLDTKIVSSRRYNGMTFREYFAEAQAEVLTAAKNDRTTEQGPITDEDIPF